MSGLPIRPASVPKRVRFLEEPDKPSSAENPYSQREQETISNKQTFKPDELPDIPLAQETSKASAKLLSHPKEGPPAPGCVCGHRTPNQTEEFRNKTMKNGKDFGKEKDDSLEIRSLASLQEKVTLLLVCMAMQVQGKLGFMSLRERVYQCLGVCMDIEVQDRRRNLGIGR
jgi:hypothetical protein